MLEHMPQVWVYLAYAMGWTMIAAASDAATAPEVATALASHFNSWAAMYNTVTGKWEYYNSRGHAQ